MEEYMKQDISIPEDVEITEPLKIYLEELSRIPLLGEVEEKELGKRIAAGDNEAKLKLEEANLGLVVSIAKLYTGRGLLFMDLVQEGNLGLMQAVERYDSTKDGRFAAAASLWIEEAILFAIEEQSHEIHVPSQVAENMQIVQKTAATLMQELGREATAGEIAKQIGDKTKEEVEIILSFLKNPASQEASMEEEEERQDDSLDMEEDASENAVASLIRKEEVAELMESLDDAERQVISWRFGLEDGKVHTPEETALEMNLSPEQVRNMEMNAMMKLRAAAQKEQN